MFLAIILLVVSSICLLAMVLVPLVEEKLKSWQTKKEKVVKKEMDKLFYYNQTAKEITRLYIILPCILGLAGYLVFNSFLFVAAGLLIGLFIPSLLIKSKNSQRRRKFGSQLLDSIMILSGSLKGGLSLLQALEVLSEEMPAPMGQEMGLVVRETKIGVTIEESLRHLDKRMNIEEVSLLITSILVARETGGDLTKILSRLSVTIRDNRKLKDSVKTLTMQGRMQGIIMASLPFLFIWWVMTCNKHHFDIMLQSEQGRILLFIAVVLQVIGMFLVRKFSAIKI